MLGAFIIVFREVIEAGIIVGIVMAVTKGAPRSRLFGALGVGLGLIGAGCVAAFAGVIASALEGVGQEIFNASILILAVLMLTWHNVWMASHGREMAADARALGAAIHEGAKSMSALSIVIAVAVMREGSEVALFMYGLVAAGGSTARDLIIGSALGLAAGVAVSAFTYFGLVTIPAKKLFGITTALITFLAAGLASQAVFFLQQSGLAPIGEATVWNTAWLLSDTSLFGRVLHTLIGYSDQPSALQVAVYAATLATIFWLTKVYAPRAAR